jgi:maltooligosyltrehalose trehalohydrolase
MNSVAQGLKGRRCGAVGREDGAVSWRVWAPRAQAVSLVLIDGERHSEVAMRPKARGYYTHTQAAVAPGQQYAFRLDSGPPRPDPCSLWQPDGLEGASAVVIPAQFSWTDQNWRGVRREDLVFYELHVGTFSAEGTFDGVIPRLRDLRELGITAIEIMPVGQFPGSRNWGYDGVLAYAAQNTYGGPHGLQRLVDACHAEGLAIFLDVVYNHFGQEGNHLAEFGSYFTEEYTTPWGAAVNYHGRDCDAVRDFVLDNVQMWLEEFHFDGLRLDAVHAIIDLGARHILRAIAEVALAAGRRRGWPAPVVAESELNDPRVLSAHERGGHGLDAQWADDFHHAIHSVLTGERGGYYADFGKPEQLATALERPFVYAWDYSEFRGRKYGALPEGLTGDRFVVCLQNHDQVGNRARGDRLSSIVGSPAKQRLAASLLLLSPYVPLVFMGEEYGEEAPFPYFCSFDDTELVEAVREGRKREFEAFAWEGVVADPAAEATFNGAKLSWSWPEGTSRAGLRRIYRDLIAARRRWPALSDFQRRSARLLTDDDAGPILELIRGEKTPGRSIRALFNLSDRPQLVPEQAVSGTRMLFSSEATGYGGKRDAASGGAPDTLYPFECIVLGPRVDPTHPSSQTLPWT